MTPDNKIITHTGVDHILTMAPTRTGKGINTVLPTLWTWQSSVIVNDIKGECWDLTSGYRRSVLKQNCIFFNPMDNTGEGISYNPLELVKVGTMSESEDARTIAITLLDTDGKMDNRLSLYLITPPKAIKMTKPLFRLKQYMNLQIKCSLIIENKNIP